MHYIYIVSIYENLTEYPSSLPSIVYSSQYSSDFMCTFNSLTIYTRHTWANERLKKNLSGKVFKQKLNFIILYKLFGTTARKCIPTSTNMSSIGLVIREIRLWNGKALYEMVCIRTQIPYAKCYTYRELSTTSFFN